MASVVKGLDFALIQILCKGVSKKVKTKERFDKRCAKALTKRFATANFIS